MLLVHPILLLSQTKSAFKTEQLKKIMALQNEMSLRLSAYSLDWPGYRKALAPFFFEVS